MISLSSLHVELKLCTCIGFPLIVYSVQFRLCSVGCVYRGRENLNGIVLQVRVGGNTAEHTPCANRVGVLEKSIKSYPEKVG